MESNPEEFVPEVDPNVVWEIEQRVEARWLLEFEHHQEGQTQRLKELHGRYQTLMEWMQRLLEQATIKNGAQFGWNLDLDELDDEQRAELCEEALNTFQMGQHFSALLEEVKRQPALQAHWEQLCLLLRLSEDDDTRKYYRF